MSDKLTTSPNENSSYNLPFLWSVIVALSQLLVRPRVHLIRAVFKLPVYFFRKFYSKPVDCHIYGCSMRLYPSESLFQTGILFYPNFLDHKSFTFLRSVLKNGDIFVDAGSHAGLYSLVAASIVGLSGRCIAIEADPTNFDRMKHNFDLNQFENIMSVNVGLSNCDEKLMLHVDKSNRGSCTFSSPDGEIEVPCMPLSQVLSNLRSSKINFIKLDIEGSEYKVLDFYFNHTEKQFWPEYMIVEVNSGFSGYNDLHKLIKGMGYSLCGSEHMNFFYQLKK